MPKQLVLLRGVTPSGKNRVPMAQLRQVLVDAGFTDAFTWIQSGNVVLTSDLSETDLAQRVHNLIKEHIGADLKIIVKTPAQIAQILRDNPYGEEADISRVFFTLFNQTPSAEQVKLLQQTDFGSDKFIYTPQAIYLFIQGSAAETKLNNNFIERKLKIDATTRNFNTLSKLVELSGNK